MHHTLIDAYELRASYELPVPIEETYRANYVTPRESFVAFTGGGPQISIDVEVDFDEEKPGSDAEIDDPAPSSTRWARARTWVSE